MCEVQQPSLRSLDPADNYKYPGSRAPAEGAFPEPGHQCPWEMVNYTLLGMSCLCTLKINKGGPRPSGPLLSLIIHLGSGWQPPLSMPPTEAATLPGKTGISYQINRKFYFYLMLELKIPERNFHIPAGH